MLSADSDSVDCLHGGNELWTVLIKVIAAFVHRFTGQSDNANGLRRLQPFSLLFQSFVFDPGVQDVLGSVSAVSQRA